jgi:hypothetical protein
MSRSNRVDHIRLTSHPAPGAKLAFPIHWGAATARERGPVIGTVSRPQDRNVIGTHGGSYSIYRALAVSSGALDPIRRPDLLNTHPAATVGPAPQWTDPQAIVSLDPWGHLVAENFAQEIAEGIDIRPSIAITRARLDLPELQAAIAAGRLRHDGEVVHKNGSVSVVKIAVDPVWYLPGIAQRFATSENNLRRALFEQTGGMFPELVTRPDLQVFLPDSPAALASSSTTARKAGRWARSPSSWSTTPASARRAATPPRSISSAPNASPASRTRASSN